MTPLHGESSSNPIYSSEKALMDYTTVKGIQQRTGVEKKNLIVFLLKELLDNALDFLETRGHGRGIEPIVKVLVTQEKIIVSNSNFALGSFTEDRIKSIFTFDKFYSSKRNIYRVSRGHLGDALKSVICIPYALATENEIQGWNEPLIITDGSNNKSFLIRLKLDRIEQTINTKIETQPGVTSTSGFTSVEVNFPVHENHYQLRTFLRDYARLNPPITFDFDIYPDLDEENIARERDFLPQTQKLSQWSNRPSIHYYSLPEFQQLIYGIEDNDTIAYDFIRLFREATNISRNDTKMTIGQLKHDGEKIIELYSKLQDIFHTTTKLETQFDTNKKIRQEAIKNRVEQLGYNVSNIKYRLVHASVDDGDSDAKFPFIFEIAILHTSNASTSYVVNGINSSARYDNPFQGKYTNTYEWTTLGGKKQQKASSVDEILAKYGYSDTKEKSKKTPSVIIVNLISPRINYEGYNKRIDLTPFANRIADTTYKISSASASIAVGDGKKMKGKDVVEEILRERLDRVNEDPDLKHTDKWTQSTVYYKTRKRMLDYGIPLTERETITRQIKEICEQNWNIRREELGIFAADRAQMYFRSKVHDVGIDELRDLKQRGTDLVIIEKEGICEVLSPFAEQYGIALLNTRGFLTDYAKELSELSEHVTILTDFDDSGLLLAKSVSEIPRIGIDFGTLTHFELNPEDVEEKYNPKDHFKALEELAEDDPDLEALLPYLENKRIEIDSVLAEVGNERFWHFVLDGLKNLFPNRNYNRAIETPEDIIPEEIENLIEALKKKCNEVAADKCNDIQTELGDFKGFILDVDEKDKDIERQIRDVLSEDNQIKELLLDVQNLKKKYDFLRPSLNN